MAYIEQVPLTVSIICPWYVSLGHFSAVGKAYLKIWKAILRFNVLFERIFCKFLK